MLDAISSSLIATPPCLESLFGFPILLVAAESCSSVTGGGSSVLVMLTKRLYARRYRKAGTNYFFKESRNHRFGDLDLNFTRTSRYGRPHVSRTIALISSSQALCFTSLIGREKRQLLCKHCVAVVPGIQKLFESCGNVGSLDEFVDM